MFYWNLQKDILSSSAGKNTVTAWNLRTSLPRNPWCSQLYFTPEIKESHGCQIKNLTPYNTNCLRTITVHTMSHHCPVVVSISHISCSGTLQRTRDSAQRVASQRVPIGRLKVCNCRLARLELFRGGRLMIPQWGGGVWSHGWGEWWVSWVLTWGVPLRRHGNWVWWSCGGKSCWIAGVSRWGHLLLLPWNSVGRRVGDGVPSLVEGGFTGTRRLSEWGLIILSRHRRRIWRVRRIRLLVSGWGVGGGKVGRRGGWAGGELGLHGLQGVCLLEGNEVHVRSKHGHCVSLGKNRHKCQFTILTQKQVWCGLRF